MRTTARETIFKILFSRQFSEGDGTELKNALYKADRLTEEDMKYGDGILSLIDTHKDEFSSIIDRHSFAFPEKRIYPADRSILLIALAEILYCDDIPDKVSVNEAANIASKYSSERSASYISGILSSVIGEKTGANEDVQNN